MEQLSLLGNAIVDTNTIALVDADLLDNGTRHPNLALMKISGFYKEQGYPTHLVESFDGFSPDQYAKVFISKVFSFTKINRRLLECDNVEYGGTGFFEDGGKDLPPEIEHHFPDYHLYDEFIQHQIERGHHRQYYADYLDYSIGFASRGCFRKCSFCVNKKYDRAQLHSHVSEWLDPERKGIYLWDDNIFAFSGWKDVFAELEATGKPFQFRQGLDIRLLTEEKAEVLSHAHYIGDFIFAFDHIEDAELIEEKLKLWRRYSNRGTKLYVLCAYDSQDVQDIIHVFERIKILFKYGCWPYIMRYEDYKKSDLSALYIQLARWSNQPQFIKKISFRQYCHQNQLYIKRECASMIALRDFEARYPQIADEYFDLCYLDSDYVKDLRKRRREGNE